MRKVYMSKYGLGQGNCLTACIASLLDRDIDDLPDFSSKGTEWYRFTVAWLSDNGYGCIHVAKEQIPNLIVNAGYCIAIFKTESSESHAKIGKWDVEYLNDIEWQYRIEEVHDPNVNKPKTLELESILLIFKQFEGKL